MNSLLFELDAAPGLKSSICEQLGCRAGELERRPFPDGESYVRLLTEVTDRDVILLCTLDRPDPKLAPLLFTASAARAAGARSVGLVAPYLPYMRQDRAFKPREAVTSATFAEVLSDQFDWLVTLDPHLHRYTSLSEIYSIPAVTATAASAIGEWVRREVPLPAVIGPDEESRQWAEKVAAVAAADVAVLRKTRSGDVSVSIDDNALRHLARGTPVIIDDIASSAQTLIETVKLVQEHGYASPVCAVVHPIFAGESYEALLGSGAARVVSTNSIPHESNEIDVSIPLAEAIEAALNVNSTGT